jgi:hypothetical protein
MLLVFASVFVVAVDDIVVGFPLYFQERKFFLHTKYENT